MKRFLKNMLARRKASVRRIDRRARLAVEALETRDLMSFGLSGALLSSTGPITAPLISPPVTAPSFSPVEVGVSAIGSPLDAGSSLQSATFGSVIGASPDMFPGPDAFAPALSSNPGASHTLYLNFDGDYRDRWWGKDPYGKTWTFPDPTDPYAKMRGVETRPFERVNLTPLTDRQRAQITEIWSRVAEDYAPFDVNVTTVDPGNLDNGKTVMVNIGDSNGWFTAGGPTGISSIGSFNDQYPNIVFVFLEHIPGLYNRPDVYNDPTLAEQVANTASHEAGHSFGLLHHHILNADGTVNQEYDPGSGNRSPIMGNPLLDTRQTWGVGMTGGVGGNPDGSTYDNRALQVDSNLFGDVLGFRADDFGDDIAQATPLNQVNGNATINGIVGLRRVDLFGQDNGDVDVFSFDAARGGQVTVLAKVLSYHNGSNLDAHIELWSKDHMIASVNPYDDQGNAKIVMSLPFGTYYVKVMGVDAFDAGQYTLTVTTPLGLSPSVLANPDTVGILGTLSQGITGGSGMDMGTAIISLAADSTATMVQTVDAQVMADDVSAVSPAVVDVTTDLALGASPATITTVDDITLAAPDAGALADPLAIADPLALAEPLPSTDSLTPA